MSILKIKQGTGSSATSLPVELTVQVVNQNGGFIKFWRGTKTEYDALSSIDADTIYFLIEDK